MFAWTCPLTEAEREVPNLASVSLNSRHQYETKPLADELAGGVAQGNL
jgi:hypothetical protein